MTPPTHLTSWKDLLARYAPRLVDHLGLKPAEWKEAWTKMDARRALAEEAIAKGAPRKAMTTVLELALEAELGNEVLREFLGYIDHLAAELFRLIPSTLYASARKQMRDLFLNFGPDESHYREKVGELAATVYVLGSSGGELEGFEVRWAHGLGTTLDLNVRMPTGGALPVEILNIFPRDERLVDAVALHTYLAGKVRAKVRDKLQQRHGRGRLWLGGALPFALLPVVWFDHVETFKRLGGALAGRACCNELPACTLLQIVDDAGKVGWTFGAAAALNRVHADALSRS